MAVKAALCLALLAGTVAQTGASTLLPGFRTSDYLPSSFQKAQT